MSYLLLQLKYSYFAVGHSFYVLHLLAPIYGLDGFVDDAVPHGGYPLVGIALFHQVEKRTASRQQPFQTLNIVGPDLSAKVGNELPCEAAPVAFAQ